MEDDSIQEQVYESEYRGKVQNREQEAKLILPSKHTYNIYKGTSQEGIITTFEKAYRDAQSGNLYEAINGFNQVLRQNDTFAEAYFNRGLLYLLLDNPELAIPDLSKAGELGIYQAYNIIKKNQKIKQKSKGKP